MSASAQRERAQGPRAAPTVGVRKERRWKPHQSYLEDGFQDVESQLKLHPPQNGAHTVAVTALDQVIETHLDLVVTSKVIDHGSGTGLTCLNMALATLTVGSRSRPLGVHLAVQVAFATIDLEMICTAAGLASFLAAVVPAMIVSVVRLAHQAHQGMALAAIASAMARRGQGLTDMRTRMGMGIHRSRVDLVVAPAGLGEGGEGRWEGLVVLGRRRITLIMEVLQETGRTGRQADHRQCRRIHLTGLLLVRRLGQGLEALPFLRAAAQRPALALARPASKRSELRPALDHLRRLLVVLHLPRALALVPLHLVRRSVTKRLQAQLLRAQLLRAHRQQPDLVFLSRCRMLRGQLLCRQHQVLPVDQPPLLPIRQLRQAKRSQSALL